MSTGTESSFRVRCTGWFSSWLVLEMNTEERRSKVSLPSGFGYSIFGHSLAGFRYSWSALVRWMVHGGDLMPRRGSSQYSMPFIRLPTYRPFLNHCLKLRACLSSLYSQDASKASG